MPHKDALTLCKLRAVSAFKVRGDFDGFPKEILPTELQMLRASPMKFFYF